MALSAEEKVQVVNNLITQAPPGEFIDVFNDLRVLLNDDDLMREQIAISFVKYNLESFTPVSIPGHGQVLVTRHGDLGQGRFLDPSRNISFKFDHLLKEATDPQLHNVDSKAEPWRAAMETALKWYITQHFSTGVCTVYEKTIHNQQIIIGCMEAHQYNPSNFCNGAWKAEWKFTVSSPITQLTGTIKVQGHYFEDASVHMSTVKEVEETLYLTDPVQGAKEFVSIVEKAEAELHKTLMEDYASLSDSALKALRRALPITRTKLDWDKMSSYKVIPAPSN
ncbi:UNVERIFIED_CONTAM: hypothetical protein FKN15_019466 [Acipenser sinensis]